VRRTIVVSRAPHVYRSHPCIVRLESGDWLVAFCESVQRSPYLHPPSDPRYLTMLTRSRDRGATWELPRAAPSYDWYGIETPGVAQISTGEVLLNQFRFRWHPLEEGRRLWEAGAGTLFVSDPVADPHAHRWRPAETAGDWERSAFPYAREDGGAFVHISTDEGRTWEATVAVDISPYHGAFSPKGVVELRGGELVLALGSHDHDPGVASFVVKSEDRGRSWAPPVEVARVAGLVFSEPAAVVTADNGILVFSREETTGHLHLSESSDGGTTWSEPRRLPYWGYPAHAVRTSDGRIVVVYGRRTEPFGIRGTVSEDGGATWGPELVIRDDLPNANLGYPSVIEDAPGELFTVYYGEDADGVTGIQGTYFTID